MTVLLRNLLLTLAFIFILASCNHSPGSADTGTTTLAGSTSSNNQNSYQTFSSLFKIHALPYAIPGAAATESELDKKYIKELLASDFTRAFGKEDEVPSILENIDDPKTKYFSGVKLKLDSFDAFIIHKQVEADYYFLCIFDKQGKFADGTWIAFTEGTKDEFTARIASINEDGSIEISQHDELNGKVDTQSVERHFYIITGQGKIKDLKENADPAHT